MRGVNPAHKSKIPILVRVTREPGGGWCFRWFLRRYLRYEKRWGWKSWRAYHAHAGLTWLEAKAEYRNYAEYWRTGEY